MANRNRKTFQEMRKVLEMRDAETLFTKARVASGVVKVAFGAEGRDTAYGIKERALQAMIKVIPFLIRLQSDRTTNRYRLIAPFGKIHYLRFHDV